MILVTAATGKVGRELVDLLLRKGEKVAAVTRDPGAAMLPHGALLVCGDPSRPATLISALRGVKAMFLNPACVGHATADLLSLALQQGVERAVLLSALTVQYGGGERRFADQFKVQEDAVKASGLQWTLLRCSDFAANTLAWAPQIRFTGIVRGAYGEAATSPIHERDVAAVGACALLHREHAGRSYVLTGPQSLSQRDKVHLIGKALGRELLWEEISPRQVRRAMLAQGLPAEVPDRMLGYLADHLQRPGPSSTAVEQILGRPALTFAQWAIENAAAFRN
jgi:uncharacterized protein YbjT (DUF2867 family)